MTEPVEPDAVEPSPCPGCSSAGEPVWCRPCALQLSARLVRLPGLFELAFATADGHRTGPDAERVGGTKGKPSASRVWDDLDQLYRELLPYTGKTNGGPATWQMFTWAVSAVSGGFSALMKDRTDAIRLGRTVLTWHARLQSMTKSGSGSTQLSRPCPVCESKTLQGIDGEDTVKCSNGRCGHTMDRSEYELYDRAMTTWEEQAK